MDFFENHVDEGSPEFERAEGEAYEAGHEMWQEASESQKATFRRYSCQSDNWQETAELLSEVLDRTR